VKFIEFKHWSGNDTPHIARAVVSAEERDFLERYAVTFAAVDNQPVDEGPNRVVTTVRAVWEVIALELQGAVLAGTLTVHHGVTATRLCHEIRAAVLRNRFHYHGIG
jgi:hypothetical protein